MRARVLLIVFLLGPAVAKSGEITSAELMGEWIGGTSSIPMEYTFRADHSFHYAGGDVLGAGTWKIHDGKKLELIYHYGTKPISSSSGRHWFLIDSISKGRVRVRRYSRLNGQLLPAEVWTKQR